MDLSATTIWWVAAGIAVADSPASLGTTLAKVLGGGAKKGWFG